MNILYLYNATQTYTATVFEHIASFQKYSGHRSFFAHQDPCGEICIDYSRFDAIVIHYTIRLPFDQIAEQNVEKLCAYKGLKALFIQDEYDHPHRSWNWIRRLGIQLVFTVVPQSGISHVYPPEEFPGVRFVSVLTGYVPDELLGGNYHPPSQRQLTVGYRGRPLPIRYGALGREKIAIGQLVKSYCEKNEISQNIAWTESARIYGPAWYDFMASCRSMLGAESGSNVFDWDGTLFGKIDAFRRGRPKATDEDVYEELICHLEIPGLMNQISPRVFEAIASRTILVLFEGGYSGVVTPGVHFISLKKDGSNLDEVFSLLSDGSYIDEMAERAYQDVIASGKYSYQTFVRFIDAEITASVSALQHKGSLIGQAWQAACTPTSITTSPIRSSPPNSEIGIIESALSKFGQVCLNAPQAKEMRTSRLKNLIMRLAIELWVKLPEVVRTILRPWLRQIFGRR